MCTNVSGKLFTPLNFKDSHINKNAIIIENSKCSSKIIFPDYKFIMDLKVEKPNYTIKNLIDDTRKSFEKELILSMSFRDADGILISNNTEANILTRLDMFKIDFNNGERFYNCINPKFLGNTQIDKEVGHIEEATLQKATKLSMAFHISINKILAFKRVKKVQHSQPQFTYEDMLRDLLVHKYTVHSQVMEESNKAKERQVGKILNIFFYTSAAQIALLNLCTFVFFNWDIMEPITTCITYLNLIAGYYFWAITNTDYEMDSMVRWLKQKGVFYRTLPILDEKEEIKRILDEKRI
jgi:hypothetical protein